MSKLKVFCFGFGQVAESFIDKLINEKKDLELSITSRKETHQIEFNNIKINSFQFTNVKFDRYITYDSFYNSGFESIKLIKRSTCELTFFYIFLGINYHVRQ